MPPRKKQSGTRKRAPRRVLGADFGVPPTVGALGGTDYIESFSQLDALAYGIGPGLLELGFVFRSAESARSARRAIDSWLPSQPATSSGFEAWIVVRDGERDYDLVVLRSLANIEHATLGSTPDRRLLHTLVMTAVFRKHFPITGPHVRKFAGALAAGGQPTATFFGPMPQRVASSIPIRVRILTKVELIAEAAERADHDTNLALLAVTGAPVGGSEPEEPKPEARAAARHRGMVMEGWFPCTLAVCRSEVSPVIKELIGSSEFPVWQIEQAACVLSATSVLGRPPTATDLAIFLHQYREEGREMPRIAEYLRAVQRRTLVEQVRRNDVYLIERIGLPMRGAGIFAVQSALRSAGWLDA